MDRSGKNLKMIIDNTSMKPNGIPPYQVKDHYQLNPNLKKVHFSQL